MSKSRTGLQELTDELVKACREHKVLQSMKGEEVSRIVDVLVKEQFSRSDEPVRKQISALVGEATNRIFEEKKHAN